MATTPDQRTTVSIRGVITLTAHTHQTSPDGKTEGLTSQAKTSVISHAPGGNFLMPNIPYISMNSVRGLIRRAAGGVLMQELSRSKHRISRNLYLSIMRGSFSRTGINAGGASYQQLIAAQDNLFAGLWGGGSFMYESKVGGERDLFPMLECTKDLFPQRYQASCLNATPNQIIQKTLIASRDDFERLPKWDVIENVEQAYEEHMASKFGANQAKRDQKTAAKADGVFLKDSEKLKTNDLNTFTQVEAIIPGVQLYFGMKVSDATDAQIGLLLAAIASWANRNALGGGAVRGRGSFTASLQLFQGGDVQVDQVLVGEAPDYTTSLGVEPYIAAMRAELEAAAEPAALSAVYPTDVAVKKAPKMKAKEVATSEA